MKLRDNKNPRTSAIVVNILTYLVIICSILWAFGSALNVPISHTYLGYIFAIISVALVIAILYDVASNALQYEKKAVKKETTSDFTLNEIDILLSYTFDKLMEERYKLGISSPVYVESDSYKCKFHIDFDTIQILVKNINSGAIFAVMVYSKQYKSIERQQNAAILTSYMDQLIYMESLGG